MVRFTFASGTTHEFDYNWNQLAPKLQLGGLRMFKPAPGVLIPLNSNTISLIEEIEDEEKIPELSEEDKKLSVKLTTKLMKEVPIAEEIEKTKYDYDEMGIEKVIEEKTPLSMKEKKELILAEMKEKSECTHEVMTYYYQEIMTGPKGKQKSMKRYFPVCTKCGVRERYVKVDKLTDDEILNARVWDK
jgi:hypothetical protein